MAPEFKKTLLRTVMVMALVGFWLFLLSRPEDVVWWLWLVPIPLLLTVYQAVLRGPRCRQCRRDFGLKEVGRTPGGALGGGRAHMKCMYCGAEETHRIGTGH